MRRPRIGTAAIALLLAGAAGCATAPEEGWSTRTTYREDVRTVALPIFRNASFERDIQFDLADALVKEINASTPWRVDGSSTADTILVGTITRVGLVRIAKSPTTGLAEQDLVEIVVDFEWRDQRTGKVLVERKGFSGSGLFVPTQSSRGFIETGRWAATESLARDIVSSLRSDW